MATIDPLTGPANRKTLYRKLIERVNRCKYQHLSLVFIDLDHFKRINDTYGHQMGDRVLKAVGKIISSDKKAFADTHPVVRFSPDLIAQLNWAKRNKFTFRGHTLVWHSQTPPEFFKTGYSPSGERVSRETMTRRMENYIHEVIRLLHEDWPGLLSAMDVVNEAVNDNRTSAHPVMNGTQPLGTNPMSGRPLNSPENTPCSTVKPG